MELIVSVTLRLLLATVTGGLIGFQRERAERPAGLRTHILVSVGSAVFTIVSIQPLTNADPTRIAAGVVTGIGFLGAGTIINQGDLVLGLTTAASLWATAGLGVAAGFGSYPLAIIGVLIVFLTLSLFKPLEKKIGAGEERGTLTVCVEGKKENIFRIEDMLKQAEIHSKTTELTKRAGLTTFSYYVDLPAGLDPDEMIQRLVDLQGVESAKWEGAGKTSR